MNRSIPAALLLACAALAEPGCGTWEGIVRDVSAIAKSPAVQADVVTAKAAAKKLEDDAVAAGKTLSPDAASLIANVNAELWAPAAGDILVAADELKGLTPGLLADAKALHAAISKLATDAESAVKLARASAKLNAAPAAPAKTGS